MKPIDGRPKPKPKPPAMQQVRVRQPMDYPLPAREHYRTDSGGWADRAWTLERLKAAKAEHYKWVWIRVPVAMVQSYLRKVP